MPNVLEKNAALVLTINRLQMTIYQKHLIESYKRMIEEKNADMESAKLVPIFVKKLDYAQGLISQIDVLAPQQVVPTTGITTEKNNLMDDIHTLIFDVSNAINSYAHDNKNVSLGEKTDFSYDDITKMSIPDLVIFADMILNEAKQIPADDLKEYGIQPEEVTDVTEMVTTLRSSSNNKKLAIIDKSSVTNQINALCTELQEIKRKTLRKLIGQYERKAPIFYFKIKAAMYIGSTPGRKSTRKSTDTKTDSSTDTTSSATDTAAAQ